MATFNIYLSIIYVISLIGTISSICSDSYDASKYNDLPVIEEHLNCLKESLPSQVRVGSAGHSTYEGNIIWKVKISQDFSDKKPLIWIDCGMQPKDWITHSSCIYIIDEVISYIKTNKASGLNSESIFGKSKPNNSELNKKIGKYLQLPLTGQGDPKQSATHHADSPPQGRNQIIDELLSTYDLLIIPVVNPDGYEYSRSEVKTWQKNMKPDTTGPLLSPKGVFLSQNFDFEFGLHTVDTSPKSNEYIGTSGNSENETQALAKLLKDEITFPGVSAIFHMENSGINWVYPYAYTDDDPIHLQCFTQACEEGVAAASVKYGTVYECHPANKIHGKRGGTFIDYAFALGILDDTMIPVFSMEVRPSNSGNPLINDIKERNEEILDGILAVIQSLSEDKCIDAIREYELPKPDLCNLQDKFDPANYNEFEEIVTHLKCIDATLPNEHLSSKGVCEGADEREIWETSFESYSLYPIGLLWIDCGMQGRDWITHSTCMFIIDAVYNHLQGIEFNPEIQMILNEFEIQIIPVVNPNGYVRTWSDYRFRSWVKNTQLEEGDICEGVFISQNFDFAFGQDYSNDFMCDMDYVGKKAESAAETVAIKDALLSILNDRKIPFIFHLESNGYKWLYPNYYDAEKLTDNYDFLEELCQIGVAAMNLESGNDMVGGPYTCGQAAVLENERGGTFMDYAHNVLQVENIFSLALNSTFDILPEEISKTGNQVLLGIQAVMNKIVSSYGTNGPPIEKPPPATAGPPAE